MLLTHCQLFNQQLLYQDNVLPLSDVLNSNRIH